MRTILLFCLMLSSFAFAQTEDETTDDLVFIHKSCGNNWLLSGLHSALVDKDYIDERNNLESSSVVAPDPGRPNFFSEGTYPFTYTDMNHWLLWFNDYFGSIKSAGCESGTNRIVMFKSCFPNSKVQPDSGDPDPFSATKTVANYQAVYRHPDGDDGVYEYRGYTYLPLEQVFEQHPDTLFIAVTAPPNHYAPVDDTTNALAHNARVFNNWLKGEWLPAYRTRTGLSNVAVFDWFDFLAYPDNDPQHPNRLRQEYGGDAGNSHPNDDANQLSTQIFATSPDNFIDAAWDAFLNGVPPVDSDGDGLADEAEIAYGLNPLSADSDADDISDADEVAYDGDPDHYNPYDPELHPEGTDLNALSEDSDGDGIDDATEIRLDCDPLDPQDVPKGPLHYVLLIPFLMCAGLVVIAGYSGRKVKI